MPGTFVFLCLMYSRSVNPSGDCLHCSFCSCYTKKTYENWSWKLQLLSVNSSMIRKKGEVKPVFPQLVSGAVRSKWAHKPSRKAGGTMLRTWGCAAPAALSWPSAPNCTFSKKIRRRVCVRVSELFLRSPQTWVRLMMWAQLSEDLWGCTQGTGRRLSPVLSFELRDSTYTARAWGFVENAI